MSFNPDSFKAPVMRALSHVTINTHRADWDGWKDGSLITAIGGTAIILAQDELSYTIDDVAYYVVDGNITINIMGGDPEVKVKPEVKPEVKVKPKPVYVGVYLQERECRYCGAPMGIYVVDPNEAAKQGLRLTDGTTNHNDWEHPYDMGEVGGVFHSCHTCSGCRYMDQ